MSNNFAFSSGEGVRGRLSASNNSNERIGRGLDTDFTGQQSADGFVTITNRREGRSYVWLAQWLETGLHVFRHYVHTRLLGQRWRD